LFWKGTPGRTKSTLLKVRNHPVEGAYVEAITVLNPDNWEQCIKLIGAGVAERTVAATLMNDESSRSHSVFQIVIATTETLHPPKDDPVRRFEKPVVATRQSRINLVDLAGSERLKKSGAQGQQLKEAAGINQSLTTLKKVIDALVTNSGERNPKKHVLVPYRESQLTQLLSNSLGGNSKTTMIACVSPHDDNAEETLLTLRYANRTKGIVNHVKCNEDSEAKNAALLKEQLAKLEARRANPQVMDEKALDELRSQIASREQELAAREEQKRKQERGAAQLAERLRLQKEARYSAAYYNSFKRVWLSRQREIFEVQLQEIDEDLAREQTKRQRLERESEAKLKEADETSAGVEEVKKRAVAASLQSARTEAGNRELQRKIVATRKNVETNLAARFGAVWMRSRDEKQLRESLRKQQEATVREHDEYMASLQREAAKQYEALFARYEGEEKAQQARLLQAEEKLLQATALHEETEQQRTSLLHAADRRKAELDKAYAANATRWHERCVHMEQFLKDKRKEVQARWATHQRAWNDRLSEVAALKAREQQLWQQGDVNGAIEALFALGRQTAQLRSTLPGRFGTDPERAHAEEMAALEIKFRDQHKVIQGYFQEDVARLLEAARTTQVEIEKHRERLLSLLPAAMDMDESVHRARQSLFSVRSRKHAQLNLYCDPHAAATTRDRLGMTTTTSTNNTSSAGSPLTASAYRFGEATIRVDLGSTTAAGDAADGANAEPSQIVAATMGAMQRLVAEYDRLGPIEVARAQRLVVRAPAWLAPLSEADATAPQFPAQQPLRGVEAPRGVHVEPPAASTSDHIGFTFGPPTGLVHTQAPIAIEAQSQPNPAYGGLPPIVVERHR
jgi:DNA-binding XRE family transcriptional regulator